ncbi:virulence associated lipoprotein [Borreliella lusitaniae]|uniref:virulence associated lipoprotein n=1 Tax=Borreliella lusitaniae TaxID=100177 RepID=UPI0026479EAA|nr:virulence associated lipoprotein [Borreliella lusitaniae]WKC84884.1 virulence associated lipoprotein [Borreliella lusitaniae]
MKYSIIVSIFVFLFLNACNPDVNTNQKNIKNQSSKKMKNTPLDDLINLIKKANADREKYIKRFDEEPEDQYGILAFKELGWADEKGEKVAEDSERSNRYRKNVYSALYTIDTNQLKTVSEIIMSAEKEQDLFNTISLHQGKINDTIVDLYSKKDTLNKLEISDIEKLKNLFEKILFIKKDVSDSFNQLLLDYKNDKNNIIQTNSDELKSYLTKLHKKLIEKETETDKLKEEISSLMNKL